MKTTAPPGTQDGIEAGYERAHKQKWRTMLRIKVFLRVCGGETVSQNERVRVERERAERDRERAFRTFDYAVPGVRTNILRCVCVAYWERCACTIY